MRLAAADGLSLVCEQDGRFRLEWGHRDWLGPVALAIDSPDGVMNLASTGAEPFAGCDDLGAFRALRLRWEGLPHPIATTVRASAAEPLLVFRIEATEPMSGLRTQCFEAPSIAWPAMRPSQRLADGLPNGSRAFGYQYTAFALPTFAGASLDDFVLLSGPRFLPIVEPLLIIAPDGRSLLLAPLGSFHEQIIAVPRHGGAFGLRCGWHGDLDNVPAGFSSELAVWGGNDARELLERWGAFLQRAYRTQRTSHYGDEVLARLSYWTDNGAAYWYRTEPGHDMQATLARTMDELRSANVPVHAVELDSWFYPHEATRPVGESKPELVPPTGMLTWEPRHDLLPDGIPALRRRLGNPPLILHSRHFSSRSPYFALHRAWFDADHAHPSGAELFEELMRQAGEWGAVQYEQDWLVESFLGVRGLRESPGRARAWQRALDDAAAQNDLSLLWCMATPADFCQTVELARLSSIRTSDDYRYLAGCEISWVWFLLTNALARALGLHAFKDVFLSRRDGGGWDGDQHAELEALLAALSTGPVAIGDRAGRSDREIIMRTCRSDGVLVKPDVPVAAVSRCLRENPLLSRLLIGETYSMHPAGRWVYVVCVNASLAGDTIEDRVVLADLGAMAPTGPVVAYDFRRGGMLYLEPGDGYEVHLRQHAYDYRILCPILAGGIALFGDVTRYASAGDRRIRGITASADGIAFEILGAAGEDVEIQGWSAGQLELVTRDPTADLSQDHGSGRWRVTGRVAGAGDPVSVQLRRVR